MSKFNSQEVRKNAMKSIITLAAGVSLLATAAVAQESVEISGNAPAICTLPSSWSVSGGSGGAGGSQFDSGARIWTIPSNLVANAQGIATTSDVGIRIRGTGYCNTSHVISLETQNGGLKTDSAAPAGFSNVRRMRYDAHWSVGGTGGSSNVVYGGSTRGIYNWRPAAPGVRTANFTVSDAYMPGERAFDVRLGLDTTGAPGVPLVQGAYEDIVTVRLSALP